MAIFSCTEEGLQTGETGTTSTNEDVGERVFVYSSRKSTRPEFRPRSQRSTSGVIHLSLIGCGEAVKNFRAVCTRSRTVMIVGLQGYKTTYIPVHLTEA